QNCILKRNNQEQNIIWLGGNNATFSPTLASSNNGGRSWNNLSLQIGGYNIVQFGTVTDIAFHSQDINTVYVSLSDKLLKTSNSGYTWTVQCDTACCLKMITDPEDGDHLWGCEGAKIKESFDAGVTWQELDTSIDSLIWDMLLVEERNHLYISTKNGVHSYKLP
ncbi:MAG: hypothetical protein U9Q91_01835, partial [Candidatus Marinimicrobia bacterium]|nr:hypothetical protein [Candidatus Neomarinimicrobiota bacterium]